MKTGVYESMSQYRRDSAENVWCLSLTSLSERTIPLIVLDFRWERPRDYEVAATATGIGFAHECIRK